MICPDRGPARLAALILTGTVVAGCGGTSIGAGNAADGGTTGSDGSSGSHVVVGGDGTDGGDADGGDGTDGGHGVDGHGRNGADGSSYSDGDAVTGSGRLTSRRISTMGVTRLDAGANFVVHVRIGKPEQATIRLDDNLTNLVETSVVGNELHLGIKPGVSVRNASLSADVTVASLDQLTASGVSDVRIESPVAGKHFQVDASGASHVTGAVTVAQALASASGASTLALSGTVGHLDLSGSGTSGLQLSGLAVRDLDVELSGTSCARVEVSDTLTAKASGVSTLRYRGAPQINRDDTSGASSIEPASSDSDTCGA